MRQAAFLLACMLGASPLHAQNTQPQNTQPQNGYEAAVAARLRGEPAEAVRLLQPIIAADPRNTDAQVQLGYAQLALGQTAAAERAFRSALAVAPNYQDARIGLARAAQRRGDRTAALAELERVSPGNDDARLLRQQLTSDQQEPGWSVDIDGSYSVIDGPQPDWSEGAIQVRRRFSERTAASARVEVSRRFDNTDVYGEVGIDQAIGPRGRGYLTLGGTPDADFRPRWQIGAGGSYRVTDSRNPTVLTIDARHAEFAAGGVQTVSPGVEQYLADGRVWLTARWINLFDEDGDHQSGYLLRGDAQATDRLRVFAGLSDAPDTSEGVVVDTRSYFGGVSYDLDGGMVIRANLAFEDRETGSDRTQFGLGLGWRF